MINWYNNLTLIQRIYALIAIPTTVILIIQTIMLFFGLDDDDADFDSDDAAVGDDGFTLFSVRGIMAMLCVAGWSGVAFNEAGFGIALTIVLSTILGFAALVGMAYLIKLILKLQDSGNIQPANAIGKVGQVYLTIPPNMSGMGKVNVTIQDKYSEFNAMTTDADAIKTGEVIRVVATDEIGYLLVERMKKK